MKNTVKLLSLLLLIITTYSQNQCINPLQIVQDTLTISRYGNIIFQNGVDIQCYNYTLRTVFNSAANVAVSVNGLQGQYSSNLFFSIKPLPNGDNNGIIPFLVRTQWGYTQWTKITFSFLAEATQQLLAGYYQLDTSVLSSCSTSGKNIMAYLPLVGQSLPGTNCVTFISGFQITSVSSGANNIMSPYEIQVTMNNVTNQGLYVTISTTSATQVSLLLISYVIYGNSLPNIVAGSYNYNTYTPNNNLAFMIPNGGFTSGISLHGFNSFIVQNTQVGFSINGAYGASNLTFTTSSTYYYLTYSYFFLTGGQCALCLGNNINYNGKCVSSCPPNAYFNGVSCVTCVNGQVWNGQSCVNRCQNGQAWNATLNACSCQSPSYWNGTTCLNCSNNQRYNSYTQKCQCQAGSNWNGYICVVCGSGLVWDNNLLSCNCQPGSYWNGYSCTACTGGRVWSPITNQCQCPAGSNWSMNQNQCILCPNGQTWNQVASKCECPSNQFWTGQFCQTCQQGFVWNPAIGSCGCPPGTANVYGQCRVIPTCVSGQVLDPNSYTCVCAPGTNWNGISCITCTNGQIWDSNSMRCTCRQNTIWNGYSCVTCPNGQSWNSYLNACSCPEGQNWNGFSCITCTGGKVWNATINSCACQGGLNWNGVSCIYCQPGQNWNGQTCVSCVNGQIWSPTQSVCKCPDAQQWNGFSCITPCPQNQVNINGLCKCPDGYYLQNGVNCIVKPSCNNNQTWNGQQCVAIACPPGTSWNGTSCFTSPILTCPAGTYFDSIRCVTSSSSATCPAGTFWSGYACSPNSQCQNGYYLNNGQCSPISQICPPGINYINNQCSVGNDCPPGLVRDPQTSQCSSTTSCQYGQFWSNTNYQCGCNTGTFWNGKACVVCAGGQTYQINSGCSCPTGTFYNGTNCSPVAVNQCASIQYSQWNGAACVCAPGFVVVDMQCVCQGLKVSQTFCDRCFKKPNSNWVNGLCQCNQGFVEYNGECTTANSLPPSATNTNSSCNVATYWDSQKKVCLPCSSGCLSCTSCYTCTSCQPGFYIDFKTALCIQTCGDGKRFTLGCDDANNINGDGCSSDCKVEVGFSCTGGSPNSRDSCTQAIPQSIDISQAGQTHMYGRIILNVKVNYLPLQLINSANDCANNCNNILQVNVVSGDSSNTGIVASYIRSTSFLFSVEVNFGKEPFGLFTLQIGINPNLIQKYFSGINASNQLTVQVNPAYLSRYTQEEDKLQ